MGSITKLFESVEKLNFIPPIVKFKWETTIFNCLKDDVLTSLKNPNSKDLKSTLVGRIRQGKQIELKTNLFSTLAEVGNIYGHTLISNYVDQSFKIHELPWIVLQKSGDYNPLHAHDGFLTVITYIKVPASIGKINPDDRQDLNFNLDGWLTFVGSETYLGIKPVEGEGYIFPSNLRHMVYPYTDNEDRISISWNLIKGDNNAHA